MKKYLCLAMLLLAPATIVAGESTITMKCQKLEGQMWCALPQAHIDAIIKNNNAATIELEKLRSNCAKSNFSDAVMPALPISKNKKSAAQF